MSIIYRYLFNNGRQPGCQFREQTEDKDEHEHCQAKGNNAFDNIGHLAVRADALQYEKVHTNRRSNERQFQVQKHYYVEPDGVEAQAQNQREQNGQGNEDNGNGFQNAAQEEQEAVDCNEYYPTAGFQACYIIGQCLGSVQDSQYETEKASTNHNGEKNN